LNVVEINIFLLKGVIMEEWKQIDGFESYYVSNTGKVYNSLTKRFIGNKKSSKYEYKKVKLSKNGTKKLIDVHRLVAETFIPNPEKLKTVNHINGIKTDNRVENLEWCSYSENTRHAIRIGIANIKCGEESSFSKLTEKEVIEIRKSYVPYSKDFNYIKLAEKYGVSERAVRNCVKRNTWKNV